MKTNFVISAVLIAAMALVACSKEPDNLSSDPVELSFVTDLNAAVIAGGPAFTWSNRDALSVFDGLSNNKFTAIADASSARLEGTAIAADLQLLYPYDDAAKRYGGAVSAVLPSNQAAIDRAIDKNAAILVGSAKKGASTCEFKTPLAYIKIVSDLDEAPKSIEISANGGESLAGTLNVNLSAASCVVNTNGTSSVILDGDNLNGTFYAAVVPQTLSQGYTVTFVSQDGARSAKAVNNATILEAGKALDAGSFDSGDIYFPTTVEKTALFRVSFEDAEFNMVSEPGFEEFGDKPITYSTRWVTSIDWNRGWPVDLVYGGIETEAYFPNHSSHFGDHCAHLRTLPHPDSGKRVWNLMEQTIPMKKNTDYTFSAWVDANNMDCYMGINTKGELNAGHEIAGNSWTQNGSFNNTWKQVTLDFNTGGDYWGYVFFGDWGEGGTSGWPDGGWYNTLYIDDVKVAPAGYEELSTAPKSVEAKGMVADNVAPIESVGKMTGWSGTDGSVFYVANDVTIDEVKYTNAFIKAADAKMADGAAISEIVATDIILPDVDADGVTLDGGVCVGDKIYMHYLHRTDSNVENPKLARWNTVRQGFIVSADGGKTWAEGTDTFNNNPFYAQANLCSANGYIYMVSSWPGRSDSDTDAFFVSRISESSSSIGDIDTWEHWDGAEWTTAEISNDLGEITKGAMSEPAIIWNPKYGCYMLFYRSYWQQGIVYRDAKSIEGPWSGEKILLNDESNGSFYAPSIVNVESDGSIWLMVSEF